MPKLEVVNANNVIEFNPQKANFKLKNTGGPKGDTGAQGPQGPKGETGAQGPAGASASVTVGSTTTLSPGADATVTNSGDTRNAILNFGIPTGARGPKGDTGSKGDTGPIGPKGAKGDTGAAATVQVGNTNTGAPGTNAQVTNAGNEHFAVFNFTIPRGDKGEKGDTGAQGPKGPAGQDGTDGFSPIATVTQEGLDAEISITDKDGTTTATVPGFGVQVVESLPATGSSNVIYLERDSNSASGNPISIADAVEAPLKSLEIQGNTTQQTYSGKNLLPIDFSNGSGGGLTWKNNGDGTITVSGTTTTAYAVNISPSSTQTLKLQNGKTYTQRVEVVSGNFTMRVVPSFKNSGGTTVYNYFSNNQTKTATDTMTCNAYDLYASASGTVANFTIRVWLEEGSDLSSPYEPYVGGVPAPNPDYPQAVQTVTGENVVKINGKNLFKYPYTNTTKTTNGITFTDNGDGTVAADGTATGEALFWLSEQQWGYSTDNVIIPAGTYTISKTGNANVHVFVTVYGKTQNQIGTFDTTTSDVTFTTTEEASLTSRISVKPAGAMLNNFVIKPQIELGSTATDYEPYQEQSYEINLGKNLYDVSQALEYKWLQNPTGLAVDSSDPNIVAPLMHLEVGKTYVISGIGDLQFNLFSYTDSNFSNPVRQIINSREIRTYTAVTEWARFAIGGGDAIAIKNNIQFECGSEATDYAPYFTPIELCKIGDYQDYIYKDGTDWKIHKRILKQEMDSDSGWSWDFSVPRVSYNTVNWHIILPPNQQTAAYGFSNKYIPGSFEYVYTNKNAGFALSPSGFISCVDKSWTSEAQAKATIPGTVFYFALQIAYTTDTTITNEALIAQLEAILAGGTQAGANTIALTPSAGETGTLEVEYYDSYDSYLWVNNRWEKFAHLG